MEKKLALVLVAVGLMAVAASGDLLNNGDFEADAGSIVADNAPTNWDWELPLYYGTTYANTVNHTIDVSAIGGGGGGDVGIYIGNYSDADDWAWNDGLQGYFTSVGAGSYTVTITYAVTDSGIDNWMRAALYDVIDNSDPATVWASGNYTLTSGSTSTDSDWAYVATTTDTWHTMDLEITSTASSNTLFVNSAGYPDGNIIIGGISMIPEPATLTLLALGGLSLLRRKRK